LARFLDDRRDLDGVVAICANMSLEPAERSAQLTRFVGRFGFERIAAADPRSLRQQMRWLGENILISTMVLARNAAALRSDTLRRDRCFCRAGNCCGATGSHARRRRKGSSAPQPCG
jgi:hypothetical protein